MTVSLSLILLIVAAVLFAIAAFGVHSPVHLGWAGAALVAVAFIAERV